MIVERVVLHWPLKYLTLNGIVSYNEYDLGLYQNGEFIVYEDNRPTYLLDLFDESSLIKSELIRNEIKNRFKTMDSFVRWYGKKTNRNLSVYIKAPSGIPIKGFFSQPTRKTVSLKLLDIDMSILSSS